MKFLLALLFCATAFSADLKVIHAHGHCWIVSKSIGAKHCAELQLHDKIRESVVLLGDGKLAYPFRVLTGKDSAVVIEDGDAQFFVDQYNIIDIERVLKVKIGDKVQEASMTYDSMALSESTDPYQPKVAIADHKIQVPKKAMAYLIRLSCDPSFAKFTDILSPLPQKENLDTLHHCSKDIYLKAAEVLSVDKIIIHTRFSEPVAYSDSKNYKVVKALP